MGVCLINLMRHFKKYQGIVPENITKQKKNTIKTSKPCPPQKVFIQNSSSCLNVSNSKLAFIVRCACARRSSKQATASAPTKEAATTLTKHDKTWQNMTKHDKTKEIPRRYQGVTCIRFTLKRKSSSHTQCLAACGPAELPLAAPKRPPSQEFHRQVSNVFKCVKPETIVQVPFLSQRRLSHVLIYLDSFSGSLGDPKSNRKSEARSLSLCLHTACLHASAIECSKWSVMVTIVRFGGPHDQVQLKVLVTTLTT